MGCLHFPQPSLPGGAAPVDPRTCSRQCRNRNELPEITLTTPAKTSRTSRPVAFRVPVGHFDRLRDVAAERGMSVGDLARDRLLTDAGLSPIPVRRKPPRDAEVLRAILGELGRIGGNVNQVARGMNAGTGSVSSRTLAEMASDIRSMRAALAAALGVRGDP